MKRGKAEQYTLSEEQVKALLNVPAEPEEKLLLKLMLYCGLRVGEAVHLNANWIQEDCIKIPPSQTCAHAECKGEWKAKSKASVRIIPIPEYMKGELAEFLHQQPQGFGFTRQKAYGIVKRLCRQAKIRVKGLSGDTIYPHVLRATCATNLAAKGMSAVALCYLMGWSSIEIGQHYIHIAQAKQEAHRQFREIMG